jgi:hypothetical protein
VDLFVGLLFLEAVMVDGSLVRGSDWLRFR